MSPTLPGFVDMPEERGGSEDRSQWDGPLSVSLHAHSPGTTQELGVVKVDQGRGSRIYLHARTKEGRKVVLDVHGHEPFFYASGGPSHDGVVRVERNAARSIVTGRMLHRFVCHSPRIVRDIRDAFDDVHEADIPYRQRFLVDLAVNGRILAPVGAGTVTSVRLQDIEIIESGVAPDGLVRSWWDIETGPNAIDEVDQPRSPVYMVSIKVEDEWHCWYWHPFTSLPDGWTFTLQSTGEVVRPVLHGFAEERPFLLAFIRWLRETSPDTLADWYGSSFDVPYTIARARHLGIHDREWGHGWPDTFNASIPGIQHIDLLEVHKKTSKGALPSNKLQAVAESLVGIHLEKNPGNILKWWTGGDLESLARYNLWDVEATWAIDVKMGYTDWTLRYAYFAGVDDAMDVVKASIVVDAFCLRWGMANGIAMPLKPARAGRGDKSKRASRFIGGSVREPIVGIHGCCVKLDVGGMYPNIVVGGNISYDTFLSPVSTYDGPSFTVPVVGHRFRLDAQGMMPQIMESAWNLRRHYEAKRAASTDTKTWKFWDLMRKPIKEFMNACVTGDTDVVCVDRGIVNIKDVKVGDLVWSKEPETGRIQKKKVSGLVSYPYDGQMYHFKNSKIDLITTPNHNMLVEWGQHPPTFLRADGLVRGRDYRIPSGDECIDGSDVEEYHLQTPTHLFDVDRKILDDIRSGMMQVHVLAAKGASHYRLHRLMKMGFISSDGDGTPGKKVNLEVICDEYNSPLVRGQNRGSSVPRTYEMDDWLRFMGWFVTEGCSTKNVRRDYPRRITYIVNITQNPGHKHDMILAMLGRMGLKYSESGKSICVSGKVLHDEMMMLCGIGSRNKKLPEWIFDLSTRQRKILLDTMILGDGCVRGGVHRYTTSSNILMDQVVRLVVSLGFSVRVYTDTNGIHQVYFQKDKGAFKVGRNVKVLNENPDPDGMVYCLQVEDNHTFLAGRNKRFRWTGNCGFGVMGYEGFRLFFVPVAESISAIGRYLTDTLCERLQAEGKTIIYGDSVPGEEPVIIRDRTTNRLDVAQIKDLENVWMDVDVWSDGGFVPILSFIKKRNKKRMYVVRTTASVVHVTEDHGLLRPDGSEVSPLHAECGSDLMHSDLPAIIASDTGIDEYQAWSLGAFVADGSCKVYHYPSGAAAKFAISKVDTDHLGKCSSALLEGWGIKTKVDDTMKSSGCRKLRLHGNVDNKKIVDMFRSLCYTLDGLKRVPLPIFNAVRSVRESFLDGYFAGDGDKDVRYRKRWHKVETNSRVLAQGVCLLLSSLGKQANINNRFIKRSDGRVQEYWSVACVSSRRKPTSSIQKILKTEYDGPWVYDLETENHHFACGIGTQIVHNTDAVIIPVSGPEDAVPLLDHCNAIVQEEGKRIGLSHPERIVLDYECCYGSYLQGRNKAGSGGKKRYAGLVTVHDGRPCEPWVDIKGFETNRSESPPVTVEVQQRVIEMLLVEKRGAKEVFDYVSMVCAEVAGGKRPLLDCIKRVGLGQPYSSYKVVPDYVRAAMYSERVLDKRFRVGDRVYTVPVKKETGRWPRTDVVGLTEFDDGLPDGFVVDWVSLSDKWVKGKVSVFFDLIGLKEQVKALGGRTLESWF